MIKIEDELARGAKALDRGRSLLVLGVSVDPERSKRRQSRINVLISVGLMSVSESLSAFNAQAQAIGPAKWGNWRRQQDGLAEQGLEVEFVVAIQAGDIRFRRLIQHLTGCDINRWKDLLGNLRGKRNTGRGEAPGTLHFERCRQRALNEEATIRSRDLKVPIDWRSEDEIIVHRNRDVPDHHSTSGSGRFSEKSRERENEVGTSGHR